MADQDTDRWVFEVLAPHLRRKMKNLKHEIQWTDLVYANLFTDKYFFLIMNDCKCTVTAGGACRGQNA